jgi:mannose-6-phosphate isomerase-like protein (cupin superfamily)
MSEDAQLFEYVQPEFKTGKRAVRLCKSNRMIAAIQVVKSGGETNLHAHPHMDGFWMVLSGRARFYNDKTTVVAELGRHQGIFIPKGYRYWFESASEEPLEIMQVEASDRDFGELKSDSRRINYTPFIREDPTDLISDGRTAAIPPAD